MAKLPRVFQKIFGTNATSTQFGVFGSMAAGSPDTSKDLATIQSLTKFTDGFYAAVLGQNSPAIQDVNALFYLAFAQIAYQFQAGISEWDASTTYYSGSFISSSGVIYVSIQDTNLNKDPLTQTDWWTRYDPTPSGTIIPYGGVVVPAGYQLCDGSALSRTTRAALFTALSIQTACTVSNGSKIVTVVSSAGMVAGMPCSGPHIIGGTTIESVDSPTQIHISQNATLNDSGTLVVAPWGVGDGTTTFNVPDLRGRIVAGQDNMGGSSAGRLTTAGSSVNGLQIGAVGGAQNVTLVTSQIPAHTHTYSGTTSNVSANHTHTFRLFSFDFNANTGDGGSGVIRVTGVTDAGTTGANSVGHTHTYSGTTAGTGGDGSHLNVQPVAIALHLIKL